MKPVKVNWHSALVSGLKIELENYKDILTFYPEYLLNKAPRRIDCLIVKKPDSPPVPSLIASGFKQYNIIDYKGPHESMNIPNFFKALSYAYSLPGLLGGSFAMNDLTLTLITHRRPRKLMKYLAQNAKCLVLKTQGVYDIDMEFLPVQLVVLPELSSQEYLWLHSLTNHVTSATPLAALHDAYALHKNDREYQNYMNTFIKANLSTKGSAMLMCEAFYELFAEELVNREKHGIELGEKRGIELGEKRGIELGEQTMSALILRLISDGRSDEIEQMASSEEYRSALMKQYNL